MRKHLATCAALGGFVGNRVGTRYAYTPDQVREIIDKPYFRYRNDDCWRLCLSAWADEEALSAATASPAIGSSHRLDEPNPTSGEVKA